MSNIMGYFRKSKNALEKGGITLKNITEEKVRCPICKSYETRRAIAKQKVTCPHCGHHFRIGARTRIKALCDKDSFHELFSNWTLPAFLKNCWTKKLLLPPAATVFSNDDTHITRNCFPGRRSILPYNSSSVSVVISTSIDASSSAAI